MRVVLVISNLGPGGAERVMSLLAGELVARGHEVWLVTVEQIGNDFFRVDSRVHRLGLGLSRESTSVWDALCANVYRITTLRRAIMSAAPHVVLSFMTHTNVLVLLASIGLPVRVVVSERVDPASHREAFLWQGLRAVLYQRADAVVVQTQRIASWFRRRLWRRDRVVVIPNPVVPGEQTYDPSEPPPQPFILGAGRLVHQKGFDILVRAFSVVAREAPQLRLVIAGEGPEAQQLRDLAAGLGLGSRVTFLGNVRNLSALMKHALAFVLSSRYEGFPNVLLEALASGLPIVATDCPSGPREILRDGEFGLLVPCENPQALADALRRVATDVDLRQRLSGIGSRATAAYEFGRVVDGWEAVLSTKAVG
jgi:GalNAc-alpha-(1->4)-GalNAc-alpha-(1->3)-diNAcBac-PP-undecaprenol alpha-1,4-N-acetyl-D-galactosaminyltransferase